MQENTAIRFSRALIESRYKAWVLHFGPSNDGKCIGKATLLTRVVRILHLAISILRSRWAIQDQTTNPRVPSGPSPHSEEPAHYTDGTPLCRDDPYSNCPYHYNDRPCRPCRSYRRHSLVHWGGSDPDI